MAHLFQKICNRSTDRTVDLTDIYVKGFVNVEKLTD